MTITLNKTLFTLALTTALCSSPLLASDPNVEPVPMTPVAPTTPPAPADAGEVVADAPANLPVQLNADQLDILNKVIGLLTQVETTYNQQKANGQNPDVSQIMDDVFSQGGLAQNGVELFHSLVDLINGEVQKSTNPKMAGCKGWCSGFAKGTNATAKELKVALPLVQKYFHFFDDGINKYHWAPQDYLPNLIKYGLLTDLNKLLTATGDHLSNLKVDKEVRAAKLQAAQAKRQAREANRNRGHRVPVNPAAQADPKGKEETSTSNK